MERTPDHEEALSRVAAFAPHFVEANQRFMRNAIPTRYGLKNTSPEHTADRELVVTEMDALLDSLHEHREHFAPESVEDIKARIAPQTGETALTSFRVQLLDEPIPEGFTGGLVQIDTNGSKYGNKW